MQADPSTQAWVTLATNDSYALGALVLASSLKRSNTKRKIVIMVTTEGLSQPMKCQLKSVFDEVVDVSLLDSKDKVNLALLERPELGVTFTKLHCWCLVQYTKCVFLDADTMVIRNSDDLFDRSEFSAAPDAGWPDCFNSGVFVYEPSRDTFNNLMTHATTQGSFDGGDQGLLNSFFSNWATQDISKHLPFLYNMTANATYTYQPAFKHYGHNVRIVHFIGTSKPWHIKFDNQGQPQPRLYEEHISQFLQQWWNIFHADVKPIMAKMGETSSESFGRDYAIDATAVFSNLNLSSSGASASPSASGDTGVRLGDRNRWERGSPDYTGADSFDNVLKKIDSTMSSTDETKDQ